MSKRRVELTEKEAEDSSKFITPTKKSRSISQEIYEAMPETKATAELVNFEAENYYDISKQLYRTGQYQYAIAHIIEAIKFDPTNAEYFYGLGVAYTNSGRYKDAVAPLIKATKIDQTRAEWFYKLGSIYSALNKYEEALLPFAKAVELDPTKVEWLHDLGAVYGRIGLDQESVDTLNKAINLDPTRADGFYKLGVTYGRLGLYKEAIYPLTKAIELDPTIDLNALSAAYSMLDENQNATATGYNSINLAHITNDSNKKYECFDEYKQAIVECCKIYNFSDVKYKKKCSDKASNLLDDLKRLYESFVVELSKNTDQIKQFQSIILSYAHEDPMYSVVVAGDDSLIIEVVE